MYKLLLFLALVGMIIFGSVGCKVSDTVSGSFKDKVTAEDGVKLLGMAEDFHAKAKLSIATYFVENPGAVSADKIIQIKAINDAFEIAYKTTKKTIKDIQIAKSGQPITLSDISTEIMIFVGKYGEFKQAIQPLLKGRVVFPDEQLKEAPATVPAVNIEQLAK